MKVYNDIIQGSPEWHEIRAGKPTASCFNKILTGGGNLSAQEEIYANTILADIITGGGVVTWCGNYWTERGKELEPEAVALYELYTDIQTEKVGFVTNHGVGCSPDRFIEKKGLIEIKCPAPHTHVEYLLDNKMPLKYKPQVQGQLYVTGREWCDWMSYHPEMPPLIIRIKRDEEYITKLSKALCHFLIYLNEKKQRLIELGHLK